MQRDSFRGQELVIGRFAYQRVTEGIGDRGSRIGWDQDPFIDRLPKAREHLNFRVRKDPGEKPMVDAAT
jgi:hypothetical protein